MGRIFGPVASRRLGRSLGVDVIPYKTCSFDCVYCECGGTTDLSVERKNFYPVGDILEELKTRLGQIKESPDILTLSGAGEPTLYSGMGELISGMKDLSGIPVAVITNSSLISMEDVRDELSLADIVVPSLDAAIQTCFEKINRPHPSIRLKNVIGGLTRFIEGYRGEVRLEILLVDGYNTDTENLEGLKTIVSGLDIASIQLNTAVRPGTTGDTRALSRERLEEIRAMFGDRCEIVADVSSKTKYEDGAASENILSMIERRPCTAADISAALGLSVPQTIKLMDSMIASEKVITESKEGMTWYIASNRASR
ncbi:MAG: radical SAM protein [Candidatus Krumholzibacteria bacterium]|nr:radical SAM protein [Candidatus Krumholzibacteria bacterium]